MVFFTSSIGGLWLGSLSQHRVIRLSKVGGTSLIIGGLVPAHTNTLGGTAAGIHAITADEMRISHNRHRKRKRLPKPVQPVAFL